MQHSIKQKGRIKKGNKGGGGGCMVGGWGFAVRPRTLAQKLPAYLNTVCKFNNDGWMNGFNN